MEVTHAVHVTGDILQHGQGVDGLALVTGRDVKVLTCAPARRARDTHGLTSPDAVTLPAHGRQQMPVGHLQVTVVYGDVVAKTPAVADGPDPTWHHGIYIVTAGPEVNAAMESPLARDRVGTVAVGRGHLQGVALQGHAEEEPISMDGKGIPCRHSRLPAAVSRPGKCFTTCNS